MHPPICSPQFVDKFCCYKNQPIGYVNDFRKNIVEYVGCLYHQKRPYGEVLYSEGPLTGPTRTGQMLLKNKIIDILKIHVKPRDQLSRTHEIYLKKYT